MRRFAQLIPVIAALVAIALMLVLWVLKGSVQLEVANPFKHALLISVDEQAPVRLEPESIGSMRAGRAGAHVISVTDEKGAHVERVAAILRGNFRINVYNVLGLAPVYRERITYSKYNSNITPDTTVYCGTKLIDLEDVDYLWSEPPSSVSLGKNQSEAHKTHLGLAKGGADSCASYLFEKGLPFERLAYDEHESKSLEMVVYALTSAHESARAAMFVRRALKAAPEQVSLHRLLHNTYRSEGNEASLRPEYARRVEKAEASTLADALYLSARIAPPAEQEALFREAYTRYPESEWLQWGYAQELLWRGHEREALPIFEKLLEHAGPELKEGVVRSYATALMRVGSPARALSVINTYGAVAPEQLDTSFLLLWRAVAKASGAVFQPPAAAAPYASQWLALYDAMAKGADAPTFTGPDGKPEGALLTKSRTLSVVALLDPVKALALVRQSSPPVLRWVLPWQRVLLLTEAWRVGDDEAAKRLAATEAMSAPPLDEMRAFLLNGTEARIEQHSDEMTLAVLWFARARFAHEAPLAAAALARAKRFDAPGGFATIAMAHWGTPGAAVQSPDAWEYSAR